MRTSGRRVICLLSSSKTYHAPTGYKPGRAKLGTTQEPREDAWREIRNAAGLTPAMSGGDKEQGDQFLDEVTASDQGKDQADESPDFIQGGLVRDYQVSGLS